MVIILSLSCVSSLHKAWCGVLLCRRFLYNRPALWVANQWCQVAHFGAENKRCTTAQTLDIKGFIVFFSDRNKCKSVPYRNT
jgi:hypothetical protein